MENTELTVNDPSDVLGRWIIQRGALDLKTILVTAAQFEYKPGVTAVDVAGDPVSISFIYEAASTSLDLVYKRQHSDDIAVGQRVTLATPEQIESWVRSTDANAADLVRPLRQRLSVFMTPILWGSLALVFAQTQGPPAAALIVAGVAAAAWATLVFADTLPTIRWAEKARDAQLAKWAVAAGEQSKLTVAAAE